MGQKTHPTGFRLGVIKDWNSRWFAERDQYRKFLHEDLKLRRYLKQKLENAAVSRIEIERHSGKIDVIIYTARPGIIIGKKGSEVDLLGKRLQAMTDLPLNVKIREVRRAETDAQLVAENVGSQLVRRIAFRRAMKRAVTQAMKMGAKGVRVACAGRLGGTEMSRREWYREGRVPLHTLRADIDYGFFRAKTTYGVIGIKVWIYNGDVATKGGALPHA
ncbi:MAG: 30S ribosomal protein S3 [Candidatus Alcyoniella australis]|nr:30S ribosomal protein S3 [Candidatus Alcyoniella australis]